MAIKSEELVSGCIAKARDDEPVFVLRSSDITAPDLVRDWCTRVKLASMCKHGAVSEDLEAKIGEALDLADQMEDYAKKHFAGGKVPT